MVEPGVKGDTYTKGDRVFAKLKGYPPWPAQVINFSCFNIFTTTQHKTSWKIQMFLIWLKITLYLVFVYSFGDSTLISRFKREYKEKKKNIIYIFMGHTIRKLHKWFNYFKLLGWMCQRICIHPWSVLF